MGCDAAFVDSCGPNCTATTIEVIRCPDDDFGPKKPIQPVEPAG